MASIRWVGGARAVAQLRTYTFTGTWVIGDIVTITYGNYAFTFTIAGSATIATFLPLLVAAYNALSSADYPAHAEQTAGGTSPAFTLTADTPGKPFAATISTNSAAGLINGAASSTGTATVASAGPNSWGTAANFSTGALPANNDTVYIDPDAAFDILYDLETSAAVTGLTITDTSSKKVGLPVVNRDGSPYAEYRQTHLQTAGGTVNVGSITASQSAQGTSRFKHDGGAVATTWNVRQTGDGQDDGMEAVLLRGTHASNSLTVTGQSQVGVAVLGGVTATLLTASVTGGSAYLRCGAGCALGTVTNAGGVIELNSAVGTALIHTTAGGTTTVNGGGAVAQLTAKGGTVIYNTVGTLGGNTVLMNGAALDFSAGVGAVTVTNLITCYNGAVPVDPDKRANGGGNLIVVYKGFDPGLGLGSDIQVTRAVAP